MKQTYLLILIIIYIINQTKYSFVLGKRNYKPNHKGREDTLGTKLNKIGKYILINKIKRHRLKGCMQSQYLDAALALVVKKPELNIAMKIALNLLKKKVPVPLSRIYGSNYDNANRIFWRLSIKGAKRLIMTSMRKIITDITKLGAIKGEKVALKQAKAMGGRTLKIIAKRYGKNYKPKFLKKQIKGLEKKIYHSIIEQLQPKRKIISTRTLSRIEKQKKRIYEDIKSQLQNIGASLLQLTYHVKGIDKYILKFNKIINSDNFVQKIKNRIKTSLKAMEYIQNQVRIQRKKNKLIQLKYSNKVKSLLNLFNIYLEVKSSGKRVKYFFTFIRIFKLVSQIIKRLIKFSTNKPKFIIRIVKKIMKKKIKVQANMGRKIKNSMILTKKVIKSAKKVLTMPLDDKKMGDKMIEQIAKFIFGKRGLCSVESIATTVSTLIS